MKYVMIFLSLIAMAHTESTWNMEKHSAPLSYSAEFSCIQDGALISKVFRSGLFTPRYYYDLYSPEGTFLARAINRVLSLGLYSPNQMEFDVYDGMNDYVGYIGGKFWTNGVKFIFTDAIGVQTGSALLNSDSDHAIFTLLSPNNRVVATLDGKLSGDLSTWKLCDLKMPLDIDERVLKIFVAFISDFHGSFIKPKIKVYHHHHHRPSP